MPMYKLLKYSHNYSMTCEIVWIYDRYNIDHVDVNASEDESFEYKTKMLGKKGKKFALT